MRYIICLATLLSLSSCSPKQDMIVATPVAEKWLGRWTGVEGTYLELSRSGNGYRVAIRDLDGVKTYEGDAQGEGIHFIRDSQPFHIHAGNGEATGMKWLADKKDCLIVQEHEGYCRD